MVDPQHAQDYRLDRMERDIAEVKASVMAIQAAVNGVQISISDQFVSRRDFNEKRLELEKRIEKLEATADKAAWFIIASMGGAIVALIKSFFGGG